MGLSAMDHGKTMKSYILWCTVKNSESTDDMREWGVVVLTDAIQLFTH